VATAVAAWVLAALHMQVAGWPGKNTAWIVAAVGQILENFQAEEA